MTTPHDDTTENWVKLSHATDCQRPLSLSLSSNAHQSLTATDQLIAATLIYITCLIVRRGSRHCSYLTLSREGVMQQLLDCSICVAIEQKPGLNACEGDYTTMYRPYYRPWTHTRKTRLFLFFIKAMRCAIISPLKPTGPLKLRLHVYVLRFSCPLGSSIVVICCHVTRQYCVT